MDLKTLKKVLKLHKKYLRKPPSDHKERKLYCNNFGDELDKLAPDFNPDKLDTIPFPRIVKEIKEYHQLWLDLLEEFENQAPFSIIHDL